MLLMVNGVGKTKRRIRKYKLTLKELAKKLIQNHQPIQEMVLLIYISETVTITYK